jgi:hypothetical protein
MPLRISAAIASSASAASGPRASSVIESLYRTPSASSPIGLRMLLVFASRVTVTSAV